MDEAGARPAYQRLPVLIPGMLMLLAGLWGGLLRLAWPVPMPTGWLVTYHGALMIGGFLGTVIGLERAVGLGRWWCYIGPICSAAGAVALLAGFTLTGQCLMISAAAILMADLAEALRRHRGLHTVIILAGAAAWLTGNVLWTAGWTLRMVVPWWMIFLVLTIAGERLELSRFRQPTRKQVAMFLATIIVIVVGVIVSGPWPAIGLGVLGAGQLGLALWLARYDIARISVRHEGRTKFIAVCLLAGYLWLAVAGALMIADSVVLPLCSGGEWSAVAQAVWHEEHIPDDVDIDPLVVWSTLRFDALSHAVFLGFVFSMIFGHAPIIFPAVLNVTMDYQPRWYLHVALLHGSVLLRVMGDVMNWGNWRPWTGLLGVLAVLVFLLNTVTAIQKRK